MRSIHYALAKSIGLRICGSLFTGENLLVGHRENLFPKVLRFHDENRHHQALITTHNQVYDESFRLTKKRAKEFCKWSS